MSQWARPRSAGERLRNNQRLIFNGDLGGRIRTSPVGQTHVGSGDIDSSDLGAGPDVFFFNQKFLVSSLGNQNLKLTYTSLFDSEHVYWCPSDGGGVYLEEGEDWQKIGPASVVVNGDHLAVGDYLVVEYAYVDDDPVEVAPTVTILRANGAFFDYGGTGPTVVGTTPLADDSESTYIECVESGYQSWTVKLETLGSYTPGTPINLHIKTGYASGSGVENYWNQLEVKVTTDQEGFSDAGYFSDDSLSDGGVAYATPNNAGIFTIYDFVIPFYPQVVENEAYLVSALQSGAYLNVDYAYNGNSSIPGPKIYEASIWIG